MGIEQSFIRAGRSRDDCVPFKPGERQQIAGNGDMIGGIGIRMARDVQYQNLLGLNVLTIRI